MRRPPFPTIEPFLMWVIGAVSICAILTGRYRSAVAARKAAAVPLTAASAQAAAADAGFAIPEPCLPGVLANLALLDRHAATLRGARA